jgi:hypothetical protein
MELGDSSRSFVCIQIFKLFLVMAVTTRLSSPEAQTAPRIQHGGSAFKLSPSPGREKEKHSGYRQMEARWRLHLAIAAIGASWMEHTHP